MAQHACVVALLVGLVATVGAVEKVRVFGDRFTHPDDSNEFVRTYVDMPKDHDGDTMPIAVGVQITPGFSRLADDLPFKGGFASDTTDPNTGADVTGFTYKYFEWPKMSFPQVGRNPFKFSSWTYNPYGHQLVGMYDRQHYDVRFFYVEPEEWWGTFSDQNAGRCFGGSPEVFYDGMQPMPADCWPGDPNIVKNIGNFIFGQGTHLYNTAEEQWTNKEFDDVRSVVWGMFNGSVAHIESMILRANTIAPDYAICQDLTPNLPKMFDTERAAPTEICWFKGEAAFKIEMRKFVMVPGGCKDQGDKDLVGWLNPQVALAWAGPSCKVPVPAAEGDANP